MKLSEELLASLIARVTALEEEIYGSKVKKTLGLCIRETAVSSTPKELWLGSCYYAGYRKNQEFYDGMLNAFYPDGVNVYLSANKKPYEFTYVA